MAKAEIEQFLKILKGNADEEYRKGSEIPMPPKLKVIGVRVPVLRKIAKEWLVQNKEIDEVEFVSLLQELWSRPIFEMRSLALELLIANKKVLKKFDWSVAESWLSDVDNWAHCDFLSCNIFGFLVLWDQTHLMRLRVWGRDSNKWFQRAGIVSTLQLIRKKEIEAEEVLAMIDQVIDNKDPMVQKAISWVLRELVRTGHGQLVGKYLKRNPPRLVGYVVREVENKLQTGLKSGRKK